ncbi:MAG: glycosyltransferase [Anaerolineae bacterium]
MKVLFICGREPGYIRNRVILKALKREFEVVEISSNFKSFILRNISLFVKFILNRREYELVLAGFYGHPLMLWLPLLTRRPIVFDAYLSTYDTLCWDRQWFDPTSLAGRLAYWLDRHACTAASRVILDTKAHVSYFTSTFDLSPDRFAVLYLGCDEETFYPREARGDAEFVVFYYGSFLPLQGIEHIVRAAKLLEGDAEIRFQIAGQGKKRGEIIRLANELGASNIEFPGWIPFRELPDAIAQASVCLGGHFSNSIKAQNVIASKTFQFLAMRKPTIVGDNQANREVFAHKGNVYMCPSADSEALAEAILVLKRDGELRQKIAQGGYRLFIAEYGIESIGERLKEIVEVVNEDLPG